jgi:hypothetical protein
MDLVVGIGNLYLILVLVLLMVLALEMKELQWEPLEVLLFSILLEVVLLLRHLVIYRQLLLIKLQLLD